MKIEINITKKEYEHLKDCLGYYDACGITTAIMKRIIRKLKIK